MRPKKTPLRMCAGCGEMKPKKELARVVRAPQKEDESGSPLPPEISLDLTGKKPGRGAGHNRQGVRQGREGAGGSRDGREGGTCP